MITKVSKFIAEKNKSEKPVVKAETVNENQLNESEVVSLVAQLSKLIEQGHIKKDHKIEEILAEGFFDGAKTVVLDDTLKASKEATEFVAQRKDLMKVYTQYLTKVGMPADQIAKAVTALYDFKKGLPVLKTLDLTYNPETKKLVMKNSNSGLFNGHPIMG